MRTSLKGILEIAEHEGIVPAPYRDSVGVWTYGVGHTAAAGGLDPREMNSEMPTGAALERAIDHAIATFREDLVKYEDRVNAAINVPLKQHEFDALVSFDFNTGGIHRANLTKQINAGDKSGAGFMGWLRPPEIKGRRMAEQRLFRTGDYDHNGDRIPIWRTNGAGRLSGILRTMSGNELAARLGVNNQPPSAPAGENIFRDDFMPEPSAPAPAHLPVQKELPVLQLGSKEKEMVRALQVRLTELRYFLGNTKGDFGPRTEAAVIAFQTDNGLVRDGKVGRQTRAALEIAVPRALRDVSKEEVAAESRTIKEAEKGKQRIAVAGVLAGLPTAVSQIEEITDVINQARSLTDLMSGLAPMTLAILGIGAAVFFGFRAFNKIEGYRIEDAQTGANDRI